MKSSFCISNNYLQIEELSAYQKIICSTKKNLQLKELPAE